MESILNNARLLELSQLFFLVLDKAAHDIVKGEIRCDIIQLDTCEKIDFENFFYESVRDAMVKCGSKFEVLIKERKYADFFQQARCREVEENLLRMFEEQGEVYDIAKELLFSDSPKISIETPESINEKIKQLKTQNSYIAEEKKRVFDEILQMRLKLIAKLSV